MYCPCAKTCHKSKHPCSMGCIAHHRQVMEELAQERLEPDEAEHG